MMLTRDIKCATAPYSSTKRIPWYGFAIALYVVVWNPEMAYLLVGDALVLAGVRPVFRPYEERMG